MKTNPFHEASVNSIKYKAVKVTITESASVTTVYKAYSNTGTLDATAAWTASKTVIDESSSPTEIRRTWASGHGQVATDLTSLSYA